MKIRVEDTVLVVKGRDRGKQGKVVRSFPDTQRVQVEGVNVVKRHTKPSASLRQAGIIDKELSLPVDNVVLYARRAWSPARWAGAFSPTAQRPACARPATRSSSRG